MHGVYMLDRDGGAETNTDVVVPLARGAVLPPHSRAGEARARGGGLAIRIAQRPDGTAISAAITFLGVPTSWAELLGFSTGMLCVLLVVRQHIANWPIGILNVLLLMVVFWSAGLYADSGLQIVYVVLGAYGWWHWTFGGADRTTLRVRRTTRTEWLALAMAGTALTGALWFFLDRFTNSTVPLPDALTTALSLLATYGQARKLVESWWLWIAADLIYIPLYGYKDLWLTAILYVGFLGLCILGLRAWLADLRRITVAGDRAMAPTVA